MPAPRSSWAASASRGTGDLALLDGTGEKVYWAGNSLRFVEAVRLLRKEGRLELRRADPALYLLDGVALGGPAAERWSPVTIAPASPATPPAR